MFCQQVHYHEKKKSRTVMLDNDFAGQCVVDFWSGLAQAPLSENIQVHDIFLPS